MSKVYYLGYYDTVENKAENRNIVLAATNKMSYIIKAIEKTGKNVTVISASQTHNPQKYNGKIVKLGENSELVLFKTLPWGNKIKRIVSTFYCKLNLLKYILTNVHKNDTLMVYHSLAYAKLVKSLKKLIKFNLVLEVEEIYSDVIESEKFRKSETDLFEIADSYIFPTELLNEKLNCKNKPSAVIYGTYQVEEDRNSKWNDGKKHLLYAGTFDPRKGGTIAATVAEYLPSDYHIHILGFGTENDKQNLLSVIDNIKKDDCADVTFDGLLSGEEYIRFVQSCDLGFSTQIPNASFNNTSFPSKVLSYMSNGLRVVSVRIPTLECSKISDLLYFYDDNDPKKIAEAVMNIDWNAPYDSRKIIEELDEKFVIDIRTVLGE